MNSSDDNLPPVDDERFDLLADGELPEAERRGLLLALDDVPGGWRRCALAFLEAQSWKQEMRAVRTEGPSEPRAGRQVGRGFGRGGTWSTLLVMAASFLIALGLGLGIRGVWQPERQPGPSPNRIAQQAVEPMTSPTDARRPGTAPSPARPSAPWQLVTVPVRSGAGGVDSIRVPAVELDRLDEQWLDDFPPAALPEDLLQALVDSGHQVRQHRRLRSVPLEDGRQLVVPVSEFEFQFVGNRAYQ